MNLHIIHYPNFLNVKKQEIVFTKCQPNLFKYYFFNTILFKYHVKKCVIRIFSLFIFNKGGWNKWYMKLDITRFSLPQKYFVVWLAIYRRWWRILLYLCEPRTLSFSVWGRTWSETHYRRSLIIQLRQDTRQDYF